MSEPVLSRKRQGAQDAVDTLETFEAFEAFDKHGLPAFVRGVDAEALYFFLALFRTGTGVLCPAGTPPRYSFCGAPHHAVRLSGAAALGPLEREDLEAFPQVLINAQPDRYRAPNSPGNGWFNPKNPDRIALVTPFFLAASLCLEETDCYAIVPKATAELALDPRRTAILELSDAAPKLTVRLGWHERTHADPGSQLIRAQLLALIQKRFGRPAGE